MTFPLMALAVGAIVAGFVGIPAALGGGNAIETFPRAELHGASVRPSRTLSAGRSSGSVRRRRPKRRTPSRTSRANVELGLMVFSVLVALGGIALARKFYVTSPEISEQLAERWAGAHRAALEQVLRRRAVRRDGHLGHIRRRHGPLGVRSQRRRRRVNGTGWLTLISAWFSGLTDRTVVDGLVNLVGRIVQEASFWFRQLADRPRAELRAADAVRRLRVRQHLSVRCAERMDEPSTFRSFCSRRSPAR